MTQHTAHLPAKEVVRFAVSIVLRLLLAVLCGLIFMKAGQFGMAWQNVDAIQYAEFFSGIIFVLSFIVKSLAWPEFDYGPESELPLQD